MNKNVLFIALIIFFSCSTKNEKADAYGTFEADEIIVSSNSTGRIEVLNINEGEKISKGKITGFIDTTALVLKKEQLIAQKNSAISNKQNIIAQTEVYKQQIKNLNVDKIRIERLLKDNAATKKQLDDIDGSISLAEKQINSTLSQNDVIENNILSYDKQIAQTDKMISDCYITNPIDGIVLTKYAMAGEYAVTGKPLYKIADISKMYLRAYIAESQLTSVKIGQKTEIITDDGEGKLKSFEGTLSWISSNAEFTPKIIQTREERVKLVYAIKILVNNDGTLKIGMPGEVKFK